MWDDMTDAGPDPLSDRHSQLRAIEALDPDGGSRQPTEADHAAHAAWAIEQYGADIWRQYIAGGWDDADGT